MSNFEDEYVALHAQIRADSGHELYKKLIISAHTKIMEATAAVKERLQSDCLALEASIKKIHSTLTRDTFIPELPLEPLKRHLESVLHDAELELSERRSNMNEHLDRCNIYCASLGLDTIEAPLTLGADDFEPIIVRRRQLEKAVSERTQYYESLLRPVAALYDALKVDGPLCRSSFVLENNLQPGTESLIKSEHERLLRMQRTLAAQIESTTDEIKRLADVLNVEPRVSLECSAPNLASLEATLGSLKSTFQEHIATLYETARASHLEKCVFLGIDPEPCAAATEQNYKLLVAKNSELQQTITKRSQLDDYAAQLTALEEAEQELQQAQQNPARLKARGSVLQDECRRRQRLSIRKPKVVQALRKLIVEWVKTHDSYVYKGRDLGNELKDQKPGVRGASRSSHGGAATAAARGAVIRGAARGTPRGGVAKASQSIAPIRRKPAVQSSASISRLASTARPVKASAAVPRMTLMGPPPLHASVSVRPSPRDSSPSLKFRRQAVASTNSLAASASTQLCEIDPNFSGVETDFDHAEWRQAKINQRLNERGTRP